MNLPDWAIILIAGVLAALVENNVNRLRKDMQAQIDSLQRKLDERR